jgi:hypothetical protein
VWFGKFSGVVMDFGLHRCQMDHLVFNLHIDAGYILVVYVDDIVITGGITRLKQFLK